MFCSRCEKFELHRNKSLRTLDTDSLGCLFTPECKLGAEPARVYLLVYADFRLGAKAPTRIMLHTCLQHAEHL